MKKIAIFDFDGTLYKGDSLLDFCLFYYKMKPMRSWFFLVQIFYTLIYKLKMISTTFYKSKFIGFVNNENDLDKILRKFWESYFELKIVISIKKKLQSLQEQGVDVIIVSASPELFLTKACEKLKVELIGTRVVFHKGVLKINGENCRGKEKIKRLKKFVKEEFSLVYATSDNHDDQELLSLAQESLFID